MRLSEVQLRKLAEVTSPHHRFFFRLRDRLEATGYRRGDDVYEAVKRVCSALEGMSMITHYAAADAVMKLGDYNEGDPRNWVGDGI